MQRRTLGLLGLMPLLMFTSSCTRARATISRGSTAIATEARGWVPIRGYPDSAWYEVIVPAGVNSPRAVVVFIDRELDRYAYDDRDWRTMCVRARCALLRMGFGRVDAPASQQRVRNAALGTADALLAALRSAAIQTKHPEVAEAGLVLFGFSAAGNFGVTFAALHPERTIGFIHFHSHLRGITFDSAVVARVPALSISGEKDDLAGVEDATALWHGMRRHGAAWAWVAHVGQPHYSLDGLVGAGFVMRQWTEAMIDLRVRSGSRELMSLERNRGWVVESSAPLIARIASPATDAISTSWVPNEYVALGLRQLAGACASVGLPLATELLGSGTVVANEDSEVCKFTQASTQRELWVSAPRQLSDSAAVRQLRTALPAQVRRAVSVGGPEAWVVTDSTRKCSTAGSTRRAWVFLVTACGSGFGVASDSAKLAPLMRRAMGLP